MSVTDTPEGGPPGTRGRTPMGAAGLALFLVAIVGGGLVWVLRGPSGSDSASMGEVSAGQALFEGNCVECHGTRALGDGPMAGSLPVQPPSLLEHLAHHTRAQLVQLIRAGVPPAMPPASLTEEEVLLVIDHVWTLVPEADVAALRAMQEQMEMMGTEMMGTEEPVEPAVEMDHSAH